MTKTKTTTMITAAAAATMTVANWIEKFSYLNRISKEIRIKTEIKSIYDETTHSLWDWSWQLCDCKLHKLRHIDRIVASFCRKKKCALLSLCKDWLTKHTSYARSHQELSVLADWSELTVAFSLYTLCFCDIYAAGSLLKKFLCEKKNSE